MTTATVPSLALTSLVKSLVYQISSFDSKMPIFVGHSEKSKCIEGTFFQRKRTPQCFEPRKRVIFIEKFWAMSLPQAHMCDAFSLRKIQQWYFIYRWQKCGRWATWIFGRVYLNSAPLGTFKLLLHVMWRMKKGLFCLLFPDISARYFIWREFACLGTIIE